MKKNNWKTVWLALTLLSGAPSAWAQTDVLMSHVDLGRTGQTLNEPTLTTQTVNSTSFGKVYSFPVDGYVYAQPLVKANLTIPGKGTFNTVFVATENSSVYAIDADSGTPIWHHSFINPAAGLTPRVTSGSSSAEENIQPQVSITSTPVIDPVGGTLYVVAETVQSGSPAYYWLHALDITTGADKVAPAQILASIGTGAAPLSINAGGSQQRTGLVYLNGVVYVGFGSSADRYPWVGWLVGYNGTTLAQVTVFCASQTGSSGAGVWMSGEAPPVDSNGNLFISTGNGTFSPSSDWADAFLRLSTTGGLAVADYFAPFNQAVLGAADLDMASSGPIILPDGVGSAAHPNLLLGTDKDGEIYLIDRNNMGQFNGSYTNPNSQIVQWIPGQIGSISFNPSSTSLPYVANTYSTPSYWQNRVYFCGVNDNCKSFALTNGLLSTTPTSRAPTAFGSPGAQPVVSAANSSATSAIMWVDEPTSASSVLHAYDATNLATELYNSNQAPNNRDTGAGTISFAVPTVANGKVFVGTQTTLDVYGILATSPQRLAVPSFTPAPSSYVGTQSVTINSTPGTTVYYTLDGTTPTLSSAVYASPLTVSNTTTLQAIAVQKGYLTSSLASGTYSISPAPIISYVQSAYSPQAFTVTSLSAQYSGPQHQGDLNVVAIGWWGGGSTVTVKSVTDSGGNTYELAVGPTFITGYAGQAIYYAPNINSSSANTVTVTFSGSPAVFPDMRIAEYAGLAITNVIDATAGASGRSVTASSGIATTSFSNDLLVGADFTNTGTEVGIGFTQRVLSVPDSNILEDRIVSATGSYAATAEIMSPFNSPGSWIMQLVAFKGASGTSAPLVPTAPTGLTAAATGPTGITLSWSAATEPGGSIAQYLIERCQGAGCSTFAQVGMTTTTVYTDSGLNGSTSYTYRVRAKDAAGNTGPYTNTASAVTTASTPSAPAGLVATSTNSTQVNLSWSGATEAGGTLAQYLIERCQGAGCSSFTQIGTATGLTYTDTGLSASTTYSYRVRAKDAAGNTGPYSNVASASTLAPTISAPAGLTATSIGPSQAQLSWTAATEPGGTIQQYLVERCQGAGCSTFTQIGTATGVTYADAGLTGSTTYSYRVRAKDAAGNTGPYSNIASVSTAAPTISAPAGLTATSVGPTQIKLSWAAAMETGGSITQYLVERCQGAGCSTFTQIGTATGLTYTDTGLIGSTTYSYRVRSKDASGNTGPYSNVASVSTSAPSISAPTGLTATTVGTHQVSLTWTAAVETGGTIQQYLIERCKGAQCSSFAQIGTAAGTRYSDTNFPLYSYPTSYSYRVRASDSAGNTGPYSAVVSATVP